MGLRRSFLILTLMFGMAEPVSATEPPNLTGLTVPKSVAEFVEKNNSKSDWLTESCVDFEHCSTFNYHRKDYTLSGDASTAFKKMITMPGPELWHRTSQFSLMYDPKTKSYYDSKSTRIPTFEVGQVYFLDLTILKKLHMPVAFKIIDIDYVHMTLSYSYVQSNKSKGVQRLKFVQKPNGQFVVEHETRFKSDSKIRDALLYREFHEKLLDDFYEDFEVALFKSSLEVVPVNNRRHGSLIFDGSSKPESAAPLLRETVPQERSDRAE